MKAFVLANISDVFSTLTGLKLGAIEANPFLSTVMEATSIPEALLVKLAVAVGVGLFINRWKPRLLTVPTVAFAMIAISNSLVALAHV
jgi:hypothetical protein